MDIYTNTYVSRSRCRIKQSRGLLWKLTFKMERQQIASQNGKDSNLVCLRIGQELFIYRFSRAELDVWWIKIRWHLNQCYRISKKKEQTRKFFGKLFLVHRLLRITYYMRSAASLAKGSILLRKRPKDFSVRISFEQRFCCFEKFCCFPEIQVCSFEIRTETGSLFQKWFKKAALGRRGCPSRAANYFKIW